MGLQVQNLAAFIELNSLLVLQKTTLVYDFVDMLLSHVIIKPAVHCGLQLLLLSKYWNKVMRRRKIYKTRASS
jgi:hypothetical protein